MNVMMRAADRAARSLRRDFGEVENLQVSRKGPADFVSAADTKAERSIREELARARPDFGFLMEEAGAVESRDPEGRRWIVDPLDGTLNFLHGLPHFSISIALEERGELDAALVYDPVKEERYFAEKGAGAYLNDRRIRVSSRSRLDSAVIATGIPFKGRGDHALFANELSRVMEQVAGIRRWGVASLDLAYVASGRFDGFWERDIAAWDVAAGLLLVREAGGYTSSIEGGPAHLEGQSFLAANDALHGQLTKILRASEGHRSSV